MNNTYVDDIFIISKELMDMCEKCTNNKCISSTVSDKYTALLSLYRQQIKSNYCFPKKQIKLSGIASIEKKYSKVRAVYSKNSDDTNLAKYIEYIENSISVLLKSLN